MRDPPPAIRSPARLRLPRRTARLRLTILYGAACSWSSARSCSPIPTCSRLGRGTRRSQCWRPPGRRPQPGKVPSAHRPAGDRRRQPRGRSGQIAVDRQLLLIRSGIALVVIAAAAVGVSWLLAGRVLRPLRTITAAARRISASSLHERLALHGPDDELKELGDTLDGLFARLEASFDAQRRFAANASHELRTPLTRERALLQVTLRRPGQHHRHLAGRQPGTARLQRRAGTPHRGAAHPGQQRSRPQRAASPSTWRPSPAPPWPPPAPGSAASACMSTPPSSPPPSTATPSWSSSWSPT